ncbi:MAG TPA: response regulator transcription factor [Chitinophagaceae bacterium]|nr:response regulator transcription factor [Chitinophagaceae bacterium]
METHNILIVDDDLDISFMLKMMLEYKGYSVSIAERVEQVPDILRSKPINLVIMDMLLSGVNGVDVCKSLKEGKDTAMIPIIMISAHPFAKESCLEAGANDFISKPFEMADILSKISRAIHPSSAEKAKNQKFNLPG